MINLILAVIFLFAVSAQGKMINCYVCTTDRNDNTYPQCKDPLEGSNTETVDSNKYSCFTEFVRGSIEMKGPPIYLNYTIRGHTGRSRSKGGVRTQEIFSRNCLECLSDKCNTHRAESDKHDGTKHPKGKTMDCYVCTTDLNDNTYPQCKDPLEGSHTETVDSSKKNCFTMFLKSIIQENGPPINYNFTVRGHTDDGQCLRVQDQNSKKTRPLEREPRISSNSYKCKSDKCNKCTEDDPKKCNSATSIHVSFLTFLGLFGSLYVLRN